MSAICFIQFTRKKKEQKNKGEDKILTEWTTFSNTTNTAQS